MNHFNVSPYRVALSNTVTDFGGAANTMFDCRFALMDIGNNNAAVSYVQIFNRAASNITVGVTAPIMSFMVPANSGRTIPLGALLVFGGDGFSMAATTGPSNSTAPSTAVDVNIAA